MATLLADTKALLRAVRPTKWQGSKLTGIDLASDFFRIDDDPRPAEIEALRALGLLGRLLLVPPRGGANLPPGLGLSGQ